MVILVEIEYFVNTTCMWLPSSDDYQGKQTSWCHSLLLCSLSSMEWVAIRATKINRQPLTNLTNKSNWWHIPLGRLSNDFTFVISVFASSTQSSLFIGIRYSLRNNIRSVQWDNMHAHLAAWQAYLMYLNISMAVLKSDQKVTHWVHHTAGPPLLPLTKY